MNKARYPQHKGNGLNAYVHIICRCIHPYLYLKISTQTARTNITMTINGCILIISFLCSVNEKSISKHIQYPSVCSMRVGSNNT